jgi:hypothetical protein
MYLYHEGSIIISDEKFNVHEISALEQVWMLDVMDNHSDIKCNFYKLAGTNLIVSE